MNEELFEHEVNGSLSWYTPWGAPLAAEAVADYADLLAQMGREHAALKHADIPELEREQCGELVHLVTVELLRQAQEDADEVNAARKPREAKVERIAPYEMPVVRVVDVLRPLDELGVTTTRRTILTWPTRARLDVQAFADALAELAAAQEVETEPVS